jgi:uncharacterized DUF497 family protein
MDEQRVRGEPRINVIGATAYDRVLFVTYAPKPFDAARPVSARDVTEAELELFEAERAQRKLR